MMKMKQNEKILRYLEKYGKISQRDATEMGIARLASRIWEIKRDGTPIITERQKVKNRDQSTSIIAVYLLGGNKK